MDLFIYEVLAIAGRSNTLDPILFITKRLFITYPINVLWLDLSSRVLDILVLTRYSDNKPCNSVELLNDQ